MKNGLEHMNMDMLDARNESDLRQMKNAMQEEQTKTKGEDLLLRFDATKESFHFTKHQVFQIKASSKQDSTNVKSATPKGEVYFDEVTNKLIVREKEKSNTGFKRKTKDVLDGVGSDDEDEDDVKEKAASGKKLSKGSTPKREEETLAARVLRKANMQKKNENVHFVRESGEMYRAKGQTKGDMVIPGRAAPHAFVQLNPMVGKGQHRLSRRKTARRHPRYSVTLFLERRLGF